MRDEEPGWGLEVLRVDRGCIRSEVAVEKVEREVVMFVVGGGRVKNGGTE